MSVPTAAGTRRVAGVSRRRPRSGPVLVRVGGWLDVITPPSSHMCGGREAPPRASRRWRGGGRGGTAAAGTAAGGHRLAGGGEGPSECVYAHACQRCAEALLRRTVVEHAGPVCPGLQTLPLRAAFAPTGAFGSACFVVSGRRWRGTRPRCGTRGVCADLARNPHGPCYRFPSSCRRRGAPAEGAAQRVCAESVLLSAATETATTPACSTPTPSETTTTPVARHAHAQ